MNEFDMIVFVTVGSVFPGAVADEESMGVALARLSRDDALFACCSPQKFGYASLGARKYS